jgi:hypothetical protein
LFIQDRDLLACRPKLRIRLVHCRLRLLLACPDLFVIEARQEIARFNLISFADEQFENSPGSLSGDRGVVSLNAARHGEDIRG